MEKYTVQQLENDYELVKSLRLKPFIKKVYDSDDNVLFGSRYVKGLITYEYIPSELMESGNPYIIGSSCSYDGKGNAQLDKDAELIAYNDLPKRFPDNKYS